MLQTNSKKSKFYNRDQRYTTSSINDSEMTPSNLTIRKKIRSKSKGELDDLYIKHCLKVNKMYDEKLKKKYHPNLEKERDKDLKRCETCRDFINRSLMLFCSFCQDGFHSYCMNKVSIDEEFICPKCIQDMPITNEKKIYRQSKMDEKFKITHTIKKRCAKCTTPHSSDVESLINCHKCKKDFHPFCFRKDSNTPKSKKLSNGLKQSKIICDTCDQSITNELRDTKIQDYFKTVKLVHGTNSTKLEEKWDFCNKIKSDPEFTRYFKSKQQKNEGKLKLPKELNSEQIIIVKKSLFRALKVKSIEFNDDLVFLDPDCPPEMNDSLLEPPLQKISEYNKKIYYQFKERTRNGNYPPVEVVDDPIQGFIVRAIEDISALTLICEYTGEVTLLRKKIFDKNDSIMELIHTPSSSTSLVICPEKFGNLARFISGVNNHEGKSKKKQNVQSIRYDIDGQVHVLLYALKCIKKNETLYYDYNAGGFDTYDTHYFV